MQINTVIFDMDGIIVDSEPIWKEAANEVLMQNNIKLTNEQYDKSTGLRTKEFLQFWFRHFNIDEANLATMEIEIVDLVIKKIKMRKPIFKGVANIFNFFKSKGFKIGLATSSPPNLIDAVIEIAEIKDYLNEIASAEECNYGKPNPEVYLLCAKKLNSEPFECICFEDSINGMIAAKAAKMKCVVVPAPHQSKYTQWSLADLQLSSLINFNDLLLQKIDS